MSGAGFDRLLDEFERGRAEFEQANPPFSIDEFACPVCEAGPGEACVFDERALPRQTVHLSRLRTLETALIDRYAAAIDAGDLAVCAIVRGAVVGGPTVQQDVRAQQLAERGGS